MELSETSSRHRAGLKGLQRNNSRPSLGSQEQIRALLSIRPAFASAILNGNKRFEFRRRIFAQPVDIILVYVTVPVQRIVAEFKVRAVLSGNPETLWKSTHRYAGIDKKVFLEYFRDAKVGYAIEIGEVRRYAIPFCPVKRLGITPPQSFTYLHHSFNGCIKLSGKRFVLNKALNVKARKGTQLSLK